MRAIAPSMFVSTSAASAAVGAPSQTETVQRRSPSGIGMKRSSVESCAACSVESTTLSGNGMARTAMLCGSNKFVGFTCTCVSAVARSPSTTTSVKSTATATRTRPGSITFTVNLSTANGGTVFLTDDGLSMYLLSGALPSRLR